MKNLAKSITSILAVLFMTVIAISCAEDVTPQTDQVEIVNEVDIQISGDQTETDETDPDEGDEDVKPVSGL